VKDGCENERVSVKDTSVVAVSMATVDGWGELCRIVPLMNTLLVVPIDTKLDGKTIDDSDTLGEEVRAVDSVTDSTTEEEMTEGAEGATVCTVED
jgi:hypothetical protein